MFKVKIIEWNRFNGYNIDRCKWTFINGKRVKNIWKDITEIYYKIIDK